MSLLQFMVEFHPRKFHQIGEMTRPYFQQHRLTKVPRSSDKLREAVAKLEPSEISADLSSWLVLLLFAQPTSQLFPANVDASSVRLGNYAKALVEAMLAVNPEKLRFKNEPSLGFQLTLKEACEDRSVHYLSLLDKPYETVKLLGPSGEMHFDNYFPKCQRDDEMTEFLTYAQRKCPEWMEKHHGTLLEMAWKNPQYLPFVKLPVQMPPIQQLVPSGQQYSLEKSAYFKLLLNQYGFEDVKGAMRSRPDIYHGRDLLLLHLIAGVPVESKVAFPQTTKDLKEWSNKFKAFKRADSSYSEW